MTRVRFHDAALSELAHEVEYYAKISHDLGEHFAAAVGVSGNGFTSQVRYEASFPAALSFFSGLPSSRRRDIRARYRTR